MNAFILGTQVRLSATFEVEEIATDPTTITFKIRNPAGTITTYVYGVDAQLVNPSTGVYYVDYTTAAEGLHTWRMAGTGAAIGAEESTFLVKDSVFS